MAMLLPMMMDEKTRSSIFSLLKYLIPLGALGVGLIAFIVLGTKFDFLGGIKNWLKGTGGKISNMFGGLFKQSVGGLTSASEVIAKPIISTFDSIKKSIPDKRINLKQESKEVARKLEPLIKSVQTPEDIRKRASAVQTGLHAITKKPTSAPAEKFTSKITQAIQLSKPAVKPKIEIKKAPSIVSMLSPKKSTKKSKKKGWF